MMLAVLLDRTGGCIPHVSHFYVLISVVLLSFCSFGMLSGSELSWTRAQNGLPGSLLGLPGFLPEHLPGSVCVCLTFIVFILFHTLFSSVKNLCPI